MTAQTYDTATGIQSSLRSLADFNALLVDRHDASRRGDRLAEWIVLGRFWLDRFGQIWKSDALLSTEQVVPWSERSTEQVTLTPANVPAPTDRCNGCGTGWPCSDMHDYERVSGYSTADGVAQHWHMACRQKHVDAKNLAELSAIVTDAGLDATTMRAVPNAYGSASYNGQWYEVDSPIGTITIGWRKRVMQISWVGGPVGHELFKTEGTTVDSSLVHAWGTSTATDYLKRIVAWSEADS